VGVGLSFRILGPLEVRREGVLIAVGAAKQRTLLVMLLLNSSGVGKDALMDALWGESPPASARDDTNRVSAAD
jgi:DNA-binding SARP family transcriptional activator